MRIAGLLILAILFPVFAHVALININTADKATLMTLSGIGETLANRIIGYRETNGPFKTIEELIHPNIDRLYQSTFDKIKDYITVGDAAPLDTVPDPIASSTPPVATSTEVVATNSSGGGPPEYVPIPVLRIITNDNRTVSSGADTAFTATIYDSKGNKRDDAIVKWSFGDGMQRTGANVFHAYYSPGDYLAIVHVTTTDGGNESEEMVITVKDAGIQIASISPRGITIANNDSRTLDLSLWRLSMGGQEFRIPDNTSVLAGRSVLFPSQVIELPIASSAALLYPNGDIAATFPRVVQEQPFIPSASSNTVQTVEPIISTRTNVPAYEEAVEAPAAATELAAAGAAVERSPLSTLLKSPWTLGFLGIVALAGGAFIFI